MQLRSKSSHLVAFFFKGLTLLLLVAAVTLRSHAEINQEGISAYTWNNFKQVVCRSPDGHIHELNVTDGAQWTQTDLTALTGSPAAVKGTVVGYAWAKNKQ